MLERPLSDRRILIVEDEYMLADELRAELGDAGATVLGPVGTVTDALVLAAREGAIDGAVLDVNLRGEMAFPVADLLIERGIPFVFTTGYDESIIPDRFSNILRCEKPIAVDGIIGALGRMVETGTRQ
ncbi:putative response regulator receiver (CheY-like protein) [Bradyrhizobium sp. ORS 375]|uniref:response regulator n=1 Tax=Bradyrhizobium sp. (strain ORS 375) TaxID=566679 RepID=UPI0002406ED9|nr:response regulator [Bradyrhizobium sp. ORS 375]CCD93104.1 putative response regulator receiver (CheY-like protein) [Bradyrhizobium sp. ORS 375]